MTFLPRNACDAKGLASPSDADECRIVYRWPRERPLHTAAARLLLLRANRTKPPRARPLTPRSSSPCVHGIAHHDAAAAADLVPSLLAADAIVLWVPPVAVDWTALDEVRNDACRKDVS